MKLKIDELYVNDKDKNGNPFVSKDGKPFKKVAIKYDGEWYSGFYNKTVASWKVGDEVEVEVEEKEFNGKVYKNFKTPNSFGGGAVLSKLDELIAKVDKLTHLVEDLESRL